MRILILTAGTGSFYCGTCIRDNALALALRRMGHDALLVPMYLPLTLDEESAVRDTPVFYGGINAYLQQKSALFRKTPRWLDKLFDAPALLDRAGKQAGSMTSARELGSMSLSMLRGEEGNQAKELDRLVAWLKEDGKPDVVCLSNALLMGLARRIRQETGAAVVCTLQGEDGFLDGMGEYSQQCWDTLAQRAADVDAFLAVSRYHGDLMTRRARLPADRVSVVHNGISLEGYNTPIQVTGGPLPILGYLARLSPIKGLDTFVEAAVLLGERQSLPGLKVRIRGTMTDADKPFVEKMEALLGKSALFDDFSIHPNLDRDAKVRFLKGLSCLSVPATYGESFGLYVIEAMAAGVPVVQPDHAAFPEIIEATDGGVLYDPEGGPEALADALQGVLCDPAAAKEMGERGRRAVREKFTTESMARGALDVFHRAVERRQSVRA